MGALKLLPEMQFAALLAPSADIGAKGELKWLPLKSLRVDPAYQREILDTGKANIRRMVEGFSWLLFGVVIVAKRQDGIYAIIDGQHRATAAKIHGKIDSVPCLVLTGGLEAEARAFSAINGNVTRIHALQSFRAKVAAGDFNAIELVQVCAKAGCAIAPYPKTELLPGETLALGSIRTCINRYSEKKLVAALKTLRALDDRSGLSSPAIMGMTHALDQHPEWISTAPALAQKVAVAGKLASMGEKARSRKGTRGGTEWINFAAVAADTLTMASRAGGADLKRLMAGR